MAVSRTRNRGALCLGSGDAPPSGCLVYDAGGSELYVLGQRSLVWAAEGLESILSAHLLVEFQDAALTPAVHHPQLRVAAGPEFTQKDGAPARERRRFMDKYIFDILIVALLALFAWRGAAKGLVLSLCGLAAVFVAFFCAQFLSDQFCEPVGGILRPIVAQTIRGAGPWPRLS